ncbi:MAG: DOPA 4,5-dioxygenase family protein [Minwuia sp.]|nr:DOPA 4,5-dioxygenase family protein [Minwuia sp.]
MTDASQIAEPLDTATIHGYHAHIYYRNEAERAEAAVLRQQIKARFQVIPGRWRDQPVGPHPLPMFQMAFTPAVFITLTPWLMLNRRGLTVLVHPETGDEVSDHAVHPLWLGEVLDLNIDFLRAFAGRAGRA